MKSIKIPQGVVAVIVSIDGACKGECVVSVSIHDRDALRFHSTVSSACFPLRLDVPCSLEPMEVQLRDIRGTMTQVGSLKCRNLTLSDESVESLDSGEEKAETKGMDFLWRLLIPYLNVISLLRLRQVSQSHRKLIGGTSVDDIIDRWIASANGDCDLVLVTLPTAHRKRLFEHKLKDRYQVQISRDCDGVCRFVGSGDRISFAGHTTMEKFRLPCPDDLQIMCDRPCKQKLVRC